MGDDKENICDTWLPHNMPAQWNHSSTLAKDGSLHSSSPPMNEWMHGKKFPNQRWCGEIVLGAQQVWQWHLTQWQQCRQRQEHERLCALWRFPLIDLFPAFAISPQQNPVTTLGCGKVITPFCYSPWSWNCEVKPESGDLYPGRALRHSPVP